MAHHSPQHDDLVEKRVARLRRAADQDCPSGEDDSTAKLATVASPEYHSPVMPQSVRLFRGTVPGPGTGRVILMIDYPDIAAYDVRMTFQNTNPAWTKLFASQPNSPETLISIELPAGCEPSSRAIRLRVMHPGEVVAGNGR